jgi:Protein of unknown function (DUF2946)
VSVQLFTGKTGSRRPNNRLLLIAIVLLAFVIQSFATQTHIHPLPSVSADAALKVVASGAASHHGNNNSPADDNPDNCPLCQLFYSGQYIAPSSLVFFLPMVAISTIEIALGVMPHYDAVSHSWRGRAPPRL